MPLEDYAERPRPTRADLREIERRTGLPHVSAMERLPDRRVFLCPIPPSTNNLTRNTSAKERAAMVARGKGAIPRTKTLTYKNWREQAGWRLKLQGVEPLIAKSYQLNIAAPVNHARDLSNCLKATEDLLVWLGIIRDDRWIDSIRLDRMTEGKEMYVTLKVLA